MSNVCRRHRLGRGQSLVEFALIAPVMFILLFGIIDFGVYLHHRITLQHAVREGARYAAVTSDLDLIRDRTVDQGQNLIETGDVTITYENIDGNGSPLDAGDAVDVRVCYCYKMLILGPALKWLPGEDEIPINPRASSRLERTMPGPSDTEEACPPCGG